ncbi:MAG TPA: GatB/YqeY domain-containing protein [Aggregatilineales bacterium]|nr:GatB/YqeY domain-containing protein [Aggregatilineales bacterium]
MTDLKAALTAALKEAMTVKDNVRRDAIRFLQSAIKQVEIDTRKELSQEDMLGIVQKELKKRKESLDELTKVGRTEEATAAQNEITIIEAFLPRQLSREEIAVLVNEAIAQTGVTSAKEMGKLMGALMPKVKGLADGKLVNDVVRELLK